MKELSEIINKLHVINEQIVEKDNLIQNMNDIITLVEQLLNDDEVMRSTIYESIKARYFDKISAKIKGMSKSQVRIEPEAVFKPGVATTEKKKISKYHESSEVKAPIRTNIFEAPTCRHIFKKKEKDDKKDKEKDKDKDKDEGENDPTYVSFDNNNQTYYILTNGPTTKYEIYDKNMSIAGHLADDKITLIVNDDGSLRSTEILLKSAPENWDTSIPLLFGMYALDGF